MGQQIGTAGPTSTDQLGAPTPIAAEVDGAPQDLGLRIETIRDTLPEEYKQDFDDAMVAKSELRTRELQTEWDKKLQDAGELRRRYEGRDRELQLGQVFTDVQKSNPELAQRAYQMLVSNTMGGQDGSAPLQQPAGQVPQQTDGDVDQYEAKFRELAGGEGADPYRPINALASGRVAESEQRLNARIDQLTQVIQRGQVTQQVQQLRQGEADFLAANPFFNEQKYIDEVHRRQQSEKLPGGQPFVTLPPGLQFQAVAMPDLITAQAQQRQVDATRPTRAAANAVQMPGHASPGPPQPPVTQQEAWTKLKAGLSEVEFDTTEVPGDMY